MSGVPLPHRRSVRLPGYDYRRAGPYFVTMCARHRACLFGDVVDGIVLLTTAGRLVDQCWHAIPDHYPNVVPDAWVVMPNHVHGIIIIRGGDGAHHVNVPGDAHDVRCTPQVAFGQPVPGSLSTIIRSFKSAATRLVNQHRGTPAEPVWQRGFYEHIIRDEASLARIRHYITSNPSRWNADSLNRGEAQD